jgi:uncharacterized protein (TIGR03437 family)
VGSTIVIFLTGEGQTKPAGITGAITAVNLAPNGPLTPQPLATPVVTVGGAPAQVSFYGEAPGLISGVLQINAIVPSASPSGDLPLAVSIGVRGASLASRFLSGRGFAGDRRSGTISLHAQSREPPLTQAHRPP